jgi:hypothetical protein
LLTLLFQNFIQKIDDYTNEFEFEAVYKKCRTFDLRFARSIHIFEWQLLLSMQELAIATE